MPHAKSSTPETIVLIHGLWMTPEGLGVDADLSLSWSTNHTAA